MNLAACGLKNCAARRPACRMTGFGSSFSIVCTLSLHMWECLSGHRYFESVGHVSFVLASPIKASQSWTAGTSDDQLSLLPSVSSYVAGFVVVHGPALVVVTLSEGRFSCLQRSRPEPPSKDKGKGKDNDKHKDLAKDLAKKHVVFRFGSPSYRGGTTSISFSRAAGEQRKRLFGADGSESLS